MEDNRVSIINQYDLYSLLSLQNSKYWDLEVIFG